MASSNKRKRNDLSLRKKVELLNAVDAGENKKDLLQKFGISKSTFYDLIKKKQTIFDDYTANSNLERKRQRVGAVPELEQQLIAWFNMMRNKKAEISGPLLIEKARSLAKEHSNATGENLDMDFSEGWLSGFKSRHNIHFRKLHGEGADADREGADDWARNVLPTLLLRYEPEDVYNCDETGLYYRATPDGTLMLRSESVSGSKKKKERLTVLLACNMTGNDKLDPFVIGKSKHPRCFKHTNVLSVLYDANQSAWMTSNFFRNWLSRIDVRMRLRRRKILLFLDRCPAHPPDVRLTNIEIVFLPANTTSILQPLDAGIIRCFKAHYRRLLMDKLLKRLELNLEESTSEAAKTVTVLDAIQLIQKA